MNRRTFLGVAGTSVVGAIAGYGGVRVVDVRPYDPELPGGETPRERIIDAARHRYAADHRAVTRIRITDDWFGEAPYDLGVRRQWHEHSRRRHLHTLTTFETPLTSNEQIAALPHREFVSPHQILWALFHYNRVYSERHELPLTTVLYVSDGTMLYDLDAPTPVDGTVRLTGEDSGANVVATDEAAVRESRGEFIRPHRTDWKRVSDGEETVTFRVSGPDAYAQVVPLTFAPISSFGDCWVEVTLQKTTGRLRRIVDNRAVALDIWDEQKGRSLTYRIETDFDQYGNATARRPTGSVDRSLKSRVKGLLSDLATY